MAKLPKFFELFQVWILSLRYIDLWVLLDGERWNHIPIVKALQTFPSSGLRGHVHVVDSLELKINVSLLLYGRSDSKSGKQKHEAVRKQCIGSRTTKWLFTFSPDCDDDRFLYSSLLCISAALVRLPTFFGTTVPFSSYLFSAFIKTHSSWLQCVISQLGLMTLVMV